MEKYRKPFLVLICSFLLGLIILPQVYAQTCSGTNGEKKACISAPEGILANNRKAQDGVGLLNWVVSSACLMGTVLFGVTGAKRLNDENYIGAIGPFLGSGVSGIATYVAATIAS